MLTGLHHIGVLTTDAAKSEEFYTKIGFERYYSKSMDNGTKIVFVRVGSCVVELIQPADLTRATNRGEGQVAHIAIACKDIEGTMAAFKEMGIAFDADVPNHNPTFMSKGMKNVFLDGPSGERLELFEEF